MTQTAEAPAHEVRQRALAHYAAELDAGRDPSALELAELFDKTDRWARGIRAAVQAERAEISGTETTESINPAEIRPEGDPERSTIEPIPPVAATVATSTTDTPAETAATQPERETALPLDLATTTLQAAEIDGPTQNPASIAQNQAQNAPTTDLPTSGQVDQSSPVEPYTAAPSWTVQDVTAPRPPEIPRNAEPLAAVPAVEVERPAETHAATGTVTTVVDPAPETPVERPAPIGTWPVLLLALPAFVAVWSGWVGLGEMAGFGVVHPLPGIADGFTINSAITLPIGVEAYAAFALRAWLSGRVPLRAREFAKYSALASLVLGALGQVTYHLLDASNVATAPWPVTTAVACLPVAVLGMGAALAHLIRSHD